LYSDYFTFLCLHSAVYSIDLEIFFCYLGLFSNCSKLPRNVTGIRFLFAVNIIKYEYCVVIISEYRS